MYAYLTGHDEFDIQGFLTEFIRNFNLDKGKILPQYEVIHSLGYNGCFELPDETYRTKTLAIIEYARKGLYAAPDYLSVMHYAERLNNILELDLIKVREQLLDGLKCAISNTTLNSELSFSQFEMSGKAGELSPMNQQLYQDGMREIRTFRDKAERERQCALSLLLVTHFEEFETKYEQDQQFSARLSMTPILEQIGTAGMVDFIRKANQHRLNFLRFFFFERFQNLDMLNKEFDTLIEMIDGLDAYYQEETEKSGKTIRNFLLGNLLQSLTDVKAKHIALIGSA